MSYLIKIREADEKLNGSTPGRLIVDERKRQLIEKLSILASKMNVPELETFVDELFTKARIEADGR